jgi:Lumazine binding domain
VLFLFHAPRFIYTPEAKIRWGPLANVCCWRLQVGADWFSVYLIPETLRVTLLGKVSEGDYVNVEVDSQTQAVVDTVERVLPGYMSTILQ